jgi:3',5'-cyclic-AMP phosphodiesterase
MQTMISRRGFIGMATAAGLWVAGKGDLLSAATAENPSPTAGTEGFRFVYLTDIHVQPELRAAEGLTACLKAVNRLDPKPDFILTGGDLVMDTLEQDAGRSRQLFTLLKKIFADHAGIPVHHCIGNHDCFGWAQKKGVTPATPGYGKKMVCEILGLERTYYRFDHKGWRFFVLDDIQPHPEKTYIGAFDEPQLAWLEAELKAKPPEMPAAAVCHIPILSITVLPEKKSEDSFHISEAEMCRNPRVLADLFAEQHVRLALSGHTHEVDRVDYRGVTYLCNGAVCGGWWKGPHNGFQEGFGVIDIISDKSIQNIYYDYGWTPKS